MDVHNRKLLTIITEAALESTLTKDMESMGIGGFTIFDVRGRGDRGIRNATWDGSKNIRIEIVCKTETAEKMAEHLHATYSEDYGLVLYISDVGVLRADKF